MNTEPETSIPNEGMSLSKLRFYSYGTVAAVKDLDTGQVEVTPSEKFTSLEGELTDNMEVVEGKGKKSDGTEYEKNVIVTNTIPAVWAPLGDSNRFTAPDVRPGSKVILLQFGDSLSNMYWITFTQDIAVRRLETVIYAFSGSPDGMAAGDREAALSKCYFLEISSHKKHAIFQNSIANGEPNVYQIFMDFANATMRIGDDEGNEIAMETTGGIIRLRNSYGTMFEINENNISMHAEGYGKFNFNDFLDMMAANQVKMTSSGAGVDVEAATAFNASAPTSTLDSGMINLNGNIGTSGGSHGGTGTATFAAKATFDDDLETKKDMNVLGKLRVDGDISCATISPDSIPW